MSDHIIPHFQNDAGHAAIEIGVKEFMCVGANPPFDHPHVFLDMGDESEVVCPYCSTSIATTPSSMPTKPFRLAAFTKHPPTKLPDLGSLTGLNAG